MHESDILDRLLGAWTLTEWSERRPDGSKAYPLGADAIGQIVYTPDGHVAAQLAAREQIPFSSGDWRAATDHEAARAFRRYFGYFGTFSVDIEQAAVIHHVEGAWFPNLYGVDQLRRFSFREGLLDLDADTDWGHVKIVWKKAEPFSVLG